MSNSVVSSRIVIGFTIIMVHIAHIYSILLQLRTAFYFNIMQKQDMAFNAMKVNRTTHLNKRIHTK